MYHVAVQSDSGKVTVVNLGEFVFALTDFYYFYTNL